MLEFAFCTAGGKAVFNRSFEIEKKKKNTKKGDFLSRKIIVIDEKNNPEP